MTRPARRVTPRLRAALIVGAVGTSMLTGAVAAQATPNVTDLEATILKIGGAAVTGTTPIPSGRTLTPVRLTTAANVTRTVATSAVDSSTSSIITYQNGLLPVGTQPQVGTAFSTQQYGGSILSATTTRHTVLDADGVRRNADAFGEELVAVGEPRATYGGLIGTTGAEVLATVSLRNGAFVVVRGLLYEVNGPYGELRRSWFFDRAALAAAGATVADVAAVVSSASTDHSLTWQELGFDLA